MEKRITTMTFAEKMKTCTKCRRELSVDNFSPKMGVKDGFHSWCKECRNLRHREKMADPAYREMRNKKLVDRNRNRRATDPEYRRRQDASSRISARRRYVEKHEECLQEMREGRYLRSYGITLASKEAVRSLLRDRCQICGETEERGLVIDHDHAMEGKPSIRGFLCNNCNCGLGFLGDSEERLKKAIKYLKLRPGQVILGMATIAENQQ
jgi:hypothetical protein